MHARAIFATLLRPRTRQPARSGAGALTVLVTIVAIAPFWLACPAARGQSLQERLDEEAFLQGLVENELTEVLEHYIRTSRLSDPVLSAQYEIAAERLRMRRPETDARGRRAALVRVLEVRARLIDGQRGDARRAIWLADQAADLLFELLPLDASGVTAIFGVPSEAQRRRAERVAQEMNDATVAAETEIERAILDIEAAPGFRESASLQMHRRKLARDERDRRIRFLRGCAAYLFGEIIAADEPERRRHFERAVEALEPLGDDLEGWLAGRARLYCGCAQARLERYQDGESLLRLVIADEGSLAVDRFAANLGLVVNQHARSGPDAALAALDDVARHYSTDVADENRLTFRLIVEDQRFLLLRSLALERTGESRRRGMRKAFAVFLDLLDQDLGMPRDQVRAVVFGKLAEVAEDGIALDEFPALVSIARADRLSREERTRAESIALYESVLDRSDLGRRERGAALFGLGRAFEAAGRSEDAIRRLTQLADDHPDDPEAERSIEMAATIAATQTRKRPGDAGAREQLRATLAVLLERFPNLPTIDRWRYADGRAAMRDDKLDEAVHRFEQVAVDSPVGLDALFMRASVLRAGAAKITDPVDRAKRFEVVMETSEAAEQAIERGLVGAGRERMADLHYYLAHLRVLKAEAHLARGEPQSALRVLEQFDRDPDPEPSALASMLRVRIDAYQALGRPMDARAEIERYVQAEPERAGAVLGSLLEAVQREVEDRLGEGREHDANERAQRDLVPLGDMLAQWIAAQRPPREQRQVLEFRVASALRLGGRFVDALRAYDRLLVVHPDAIELLFGRAECLFGIGGEDLGEAMQIYRRVAHEGPELGHDYYWQSQLRMLQILDRVQRNTDGIIPRLRRLRLQDPALGGPRYRRDFERLGNKYA